MKLYESEIHTFVRTRLDELSADSSDMFLDQIDDRNLDETIDNLIEEAIVYCHGKAPVQMLEGTEVTEQSPDMFKCWLLSDGVLDIDLRKQTGFKVLRLVSFRSMDSDIIVTEPVNEDSPMGRMQLNEYIRGAFDSPVLVYMQDSADFHPHYRYYTVKSTTTASNIQFSLTYFGVPERKSEGNAYFWNISAKLKEAVMNHVTGQTLRSYREEQQAQVFLARAVEYMQ